MTRRRGNNEGTVFQDKDGVWWAQLPPDEQGKRPKRRAKTQREAQEKLRQLVREREKGVNLSAKQPSVTSFMNTWLETVIKVRRKPRTYETYKQYVRLYIDPYLGETRLDKLTPARIQAWVNTLQEKVQPQTARNAYQRLRTALGLAVKWRQLSENPAIGVDVPSSSRVPIRPLNASQAAALLEAVRGHRLAPLYDLALGLGLRQGELLGLRWSNVDLDKGVLRVAEQMQRLRSRETVTVKPKTPRSERELPLSEELISRLRAHRTNQDEERMVISERWKDYDLVFPSEVGTVIMARNLVRHFKAALQRAKLPSSFRFHDLRHTAATLMLAAGVPLKTVSDILGHSSIQVTADTYGYTFEEDKQRALDTLAQALGKKPEAAREKQSTPPEEKPIEPPQEGNEPS
jgi:integrase